MTDEKKKEQPPQRPLEKAADRVRGSAQTLLTAFAAVGAILAAGLQLGDLGALSVDDCARLIASLGGLVIAVVGVVLAIAASASVAVSSDVSLKWLNDKPNSLAARTINDDAVLRRGKSLNELAAELESAATEANGTYKEILDLGDVTDDDERAKRRDLEEDLKLEDAELRWLESIRGDVLEVASFLRVKDAYNSAKQRILIGAVLVAIGVTAFAWGSNPPSTPQIDPGELLPKSPSGRHRCPDRSRRGGIPRSAGRRLRP